MLLAFLLVVTVSGETQTTDDMYFRDVHRCSYFAYHLEHNAKGKKQLEIAAYCLPKMVPEGTIFWD